MEKIEEIFIEKYKKENPDKFNSLILPLLNSLSLEKQEDERTAVFESRLFDDLNKILDLKMR